MAKQPESKLQRKIRIALEDEIGGWWVKIWGGPFQRAGIPDILGCARGLFFALEVKTTRGKASTIQLETIDDIITEGLGVAAVVRSVDDALSIVRQGLEAAGRLPTKCRVLRLRTENRRLVLRARDRKNVDRRGTDRGFDLRPVQRTRGRAKK